MLPLLARARTEIADVDDAARTVMGRGGGTLVRLVLGIVAARLLVRAVLVPLALVGSLGVVLAVVLVMAGGILLTARVLGLG